MMDTKMDLKEIERRAWLANFDDGLWDMYIGGMFLHTALANYVYTPLGGDMLRIIMTLVDFALLIILFMAGKRYITVPRLGFAKPGPQRKAKRRKLLIIVALAVNITFVVFLFGVFLRGDRAPLFAPNIIGIFITLLVGGTFTLIAYFHDFPRGYYIATVATLGIGIREVFDLSAAIPIMGAMIALPGIFLFVRFVRTHPIPRLEERNGEAE
jgi:hypothetical protein